MTKARLQCLTWPSFLYVVTTTSVLYILAYLLPILFPGFRALATIASFLLSHCWTSLVLSQKSSGIYVRSHNFLSVYSSSTMSESHKFSCPE